MPYKVAVCVMETNVMVFVAGEFKFDAFGFVEKHMLCCGRARIRMDIHT